MRILLWLLPTMICSQLADNQTYLYFAPTHGRIGNQIEQLLGMMALSLEANRTLIFPDFILYSSDRRKLPFTDLFSSDFGIYIHNFKPSRVHCKTKELYQDRVHWHKNFQPNVEVVDIGNVIQMTDQLIATPYPLSKFPVNPAHRYMQSKLNWSTKIIDQTILPPRPYVGLHLRQGNDWKSIIPTAIGSSSFFAHPQNNRTMGIVLTADMIYQDVSYITDVIRRQTIKNIFIASDVRVNIVVDQYNIFFGSLDLFEHDLYTLEQADLFIGNTVSSFSSCVTRMREERDVQTEFFGIDYKRKKDDL